MLKFSSFAIIVRTAGYCNSSRLCNRPGRLVDTTAVLKQQLQVYLPVGTIRDPWGQASSVPTTCLCPLYTTPNPTYQPCRNFYASSIYSDVNLSGTV